MKGNCAAWSKAVVPTRECRSIVRSKDQSILEPTFLMSRLFVAESRSLSMRPIEHGPRQLARREIHVIPS